MLSRKFAFTFLIAVSLPLVARAEMSDEDRRARCANNQARLGELETQLKSDPDYLTLDENARERSALVAAKSIVSSVASLSYDPPIDAKQRYLAALSRLRGFRDSLHVSARCDIQVPLENVMVGVVLERVLDCGRDLEVTINRRVGLAEASDQRAALIRTEIAQRRARMTELQCNVVQPGPDTADLSIGSRFAQLRGRLSQEQYADAYGRLAVLLAGYGGRIGWKNAQDPSVPGDPGRGITNFAAHHDHVINHGGGDVAGSIENRLDELHQGLSPSDYAAMEREASQLLTGFGV